MTLDELKEIARLRQQAKDRVKMASEANTFGLPVSEVVELDVNFRISSAEYKAYSEKYESALNEYVKEIVKV